MTMTRRDFEQVALILSTVADWDERERLIGEFMRMFEDRNPRFDAMRFRMRVCELRGGE